MATRFPIYIVSAAITTSLTDKRFHEKNLNIVVSNQRPKLSGISISYEVFLSCTWKWEPCMDAPFESELIDHLSINSILYEMQMPQSCSSIKCTCENHVNCWSDSVDCDRFTIIIEILTVRSSQKSTNQKQVSAAIGFGYRDTVAAILEMRLIKEKWVQC